MPAKYNKNLKPLARKLRKFGTKGEALLWRDVLKAKQHCLISLTASILLVITLLILFAGS